jgi:hypothetical protein
MKNARIIWESVDLDIADAYNICHRKFRLKLMEVANGVVS